ncbi:MAG: OadG family protein [Deltaproteobacteria bacterium]|nr:OadG family protein [Deltaproteobacteria bacterium]
MYGIEAINAYNGWAMALAGALIVMCGLAVLSFVISKLHIVVDLMEKRKQDSPDASLAIPSASSKPALTAEHDLSNLESSVACYYTETAKLGKTFTLQDLFAVFRECDFPHPHLTIRSLKEKGLLIPAGEGLFTWKG